jgi:hypothetical protein
MLRAATIVWTALAALVATAPAHAAPDDAVYRLANGCYTLTSTSTRQAVALVGSGWGLRPAGAGAPVRFKAITLGRFMLLEPGGALLASDGRAIALTRTPGPPADFTLERAGDAFTLTPTGSAMRVIAGPAGLRLGANGAGAAFALSPATGCAEFPEAQVDASGPVYTGPTPYGETRGFLDAHMHMMGFEFLGGRMHCGAPWSAYGVTVALKGCEGTALSNVVASTLLSSNANVPTDTVGWPTFRQWPRWDALAYEQSYYKWLERAWRGGLRIFVNLFVENHALCAIAPERRPGYDCNEMDSVRRQAADLRNLETYVDAQSGGPGKGWFRIVADPFAARRVVNAGKLAVVPGIEVSSLFDCGLRLGVSPCTTADVDRGLDEAYNTLGVRDMELINKFDNGFGGVTGDDSTTGAIVNAGNFLETGRFWDMRPCAEHDESSADHPQVAVPALLAPVAAALPAGATPVYGPGPHCNAMGLTALGERLVRRMMDRRMIIDPDHLDVIARRQLLSIVESRRYSGIISSHSWSTKDAFPRIYKLGGMVTPYAGDATAFVASWRELRAMRDARFYGGIGWGADMSGFGAQGRPRNGPNPVRYPFRSWDGRVTLDRPRTGTRTFDVNRDGVAHYGLYPDWVEDLRMVAGKEIVDDLVRGPEAYLQMWERAVGVAPASSCRQARLRVRPDGLGLVRIATPAEEVLRGAGQPVRRVGRTWRYCVAGREGGSVRVVFTPSGTSGLIVSSAPRHRIGGVGRGSRVAGLRGAGVLRPGLMARDAGRGRRYLFGVSAGRVRYVALAAASVARDPRELRRELKLAGVSHRGRR